jgi:hypothetical protein
LGHGPEDVHRPGFGEGGQPGIAARGLSAAEGVAPELPHVVLEQVDDLRDQCSEAEELIGQCWLQLCNTVSVLAENVDDHTQIRK